MFYMAVELPRRLELLNKNYITINQTLNIINVVESYLIKTIYEI